MSAIIVRREVPGVLPLTGSPLLDRIYTARRVRSARELDHRLECLTPPAFEGLGEALALLAEALERRWRILVVGDFDADGATGTALAVRGLRAMGARDVRFRVPDRFRFGYGLSPDLVAALAPERPQLLITVDNGISSLQGVAAARELGCRVLVTDHHLPGPELPAADAIIDPNQPGDESGANNLAGVGVIFFVLAALRRHLDDAGWFARENLPRPNLAGFLDLVALGTVADVVPLDHGNRVLVEQGLRRIRAGRCVPGISALARVAGCRQAQLDATDIGFRLGPRLNAAGRLEDMSIGIDCLLSDDPAEAEAVAARLDGLNRERRAIGERMQTEAEQALEILQLDAALPYGLCLFDEGWHQGVLGILAARVRERTHRPVIALAPDGEDLVKGSARSVPGLHIRDSIAAVDGRHPGLIRKFGGHASAAGLTLAREALPLFQDAFDAEVRRHLGPEDLRGVLYSDGELGAGEFSLPVAEALRAAGPWGQGFPEPLFDGVFQVLAHRPVGRNHCQLTLRPRGSDISVQAMAFNRVLPWSAPWPELRIAYRLEVNEFRNRRSARLIVEHLELADDRHPY